MPITHTTPPDANVFAEIGFSHAEAENLRLRADLMMRIHQLVDDRGLDDGAAAALFGVSVERLRDVVGGRLHALSLDALVAMLAHAGFRMDLTVRSAA
jgi:predicted XRE-type DNA-binding protein